MRVVVVCASSPGSPTCLEPSPRCRGRAVVSSRDRRRRHGAGTRGLSRRHAQGCQAKGASFEAPLRREVEFWKQAAEKKKQAAAKKTAEKKEASEAGAPARVARRPVGCGGHVASFGGRLERRSTRRSTRRRVRRRRRRRRPRRRRRQIQGTLLGSRGVPRGCLGSAAASSAVSS